VVAAVEAKVAAPFASVVTLLVNVLYVPTLTKAADEPIHAAGRPGEITSDRSVLALKPVTVMNACADAVLAGAKGVPELTVAPSSTVAFGVTVNVAVPTLPRLSTTVTVCAPATPVCEVAFPAGAVNTKAAVPCSVTVALVNAARLLEVALLPTITELIVAVGPKPVTVAVTFVPTGPVAGDSVTVGVVRDSVEPPTLFQASVKLKAAPYVELYPGRLTVAVNVPKDAPKKLAIVLLLKVVGLLVLVYGAERTVIVVPEKFASMILFENVSMVASDVGNPEAETVTDVPPTIEDGEIVTVGLVIVNVPATTEWCASEIITVCAPGERL